jgi:hypothetical protein
MFLLVAYLILQVTFYPTILTAMNAKFLREESAKRLVAFE